MVLVYISVWYVWQEILRGHQSHCMGSYTNRKEKVDRNSWSWLEWVELKKGTEKVDCGRPRPCVDSKCILGQSNDSECRPLLNVWTGEIVCEASSVCTKLAQIHYTNCNDRAATVIHWELCRSRIFLMDDNWCEHVPWKGMGSVKIPWHVNVPTDD